MPRTVLELRLPLLSLQKMSLIKIATVLCNNRQLLNLIMNCKFEEYFADRPHTRKSKEWKSVQAMANNLLSQICICAKLRDNIMELLWPVCYRILQWKSVYAPSIENQFFQHFYWTDRGRIDIRKTAVFLIGNKRIPIRGRFALACCTCLDKGMHELWREMTNDDVTFFFRGKTRNKISPLIVFWINTMTGFQYPESHMHHLCICAFDNGLLEAVKYLFSITPDQIRKNLAFMYTINLINKLTELNFLEESEVDIAYFFHLEMSHDSREAVYHFPLMRLWLLLHFSDSENFLKELEEELQSASVPNVGKLLFMAFYGYHLEVFKNKDYREVFVNIWQKTPVSMRNPVAESYTGQYFLSILIRDDFTFLLRKGASQKISSFDLKHTTSIPSAYGHHQDKWGFLHFLIEEMTTIPSLKQCKNDMVRDMRIRKSNKAAWNCLLRSVRKIKSKDRKQED